MDKNKQRNQITIFISGKISGEDYNECKKKFDKVKRIAKDRYPDAAILSPLDIDLRNVTWDEAMYVTDSMIVVSDMVIFLPDWRRSRGAKEEMYRATNQLSGKQILILTEDDELRQQNEEDISYVFKCCRS